MSDLQWHQQLTAEMALNALLWEVTRFLDRMKTAVQDPPQASAPPSLLSEVALAHLRRDAMLVSLIERSVFGGDADGAPGVVLVDIKGKILGFHEAEAARLKSEITALERRLGSVNK